MKNPIGVMQGRLLPKYMGRYQAHPVGYWQQEFQYAADLDLDCIEFILDYDKVESNPLLNDRGIDEIISLSDKTGVKIYSICADYFMEAPLHSRNEDSAQKNRKILKNLLDKTRRLGVKNIVIPCVDNSSLHNDEDIMRFYNGLSPLIETAENYDINLSLETDLQPNRFVELLDKFDSNKVTVNYDTGNSAALGYDIEQEFKCYGQDITDIHIKDRVLGGGSVILGTGSTNFRELFKSVKIYNYKGPFIMQAYRDDEGKSVFLSQLEWIKKYMVEYLN